MSSPEDPNAQTHPPKPDPPQMPYQRPGKLGVDYDEYGEEMAPNARVWKKYVEETDRTDKEMVDGWNGLLDIILLFAALFSAISTAFVIESSKDLKPDPAETSAQTLQLISQILLATSTGSPANLSSSVNSDPPPFSPTWSAVVVNGLWFASLSLSVAVSLVAILAKEWCRSFMSGRVGSTLRQARLRQQRWDGIGRWGMKWILSLLPLLMHTALLLFAIGLSVFLWNINTQVALPVIVIAVLATLFYLVTAMLPFLFRFCPYKSAITTLLYPYWIPTIEIIWRSPSTIGSLFDGLLDFFDLYLGLKDRFGWAVEHAHRWGQLMRETLSTERSELIEQDSPMDKVTSSMLSWMITNCEESQSVDLALQALAGADPRLFRESLWECGAIELVAQRLRVYLDFLDNSHTGRQDLRRDNLLDYACLYSRSLNFLIESIQDKTCGLLVHYRLSSSKEVEYIWTSHEERVYNTSRCVYSNTLLNHAYSGPAPRYEIAALELNNMHFGILQFSDTPGEGTVGSDGGLDQAESRQQFSRQQELLEQITTNKLTILPLAAVLALVDASTKSYLYNPRQSLYHLVDLLNMTTSGKGKPAIRHAIGIALTVAAFANHDFPGGDAPANGGEARLRRARQVYWQLKMKRADQKETGSLLIFGLFGFLMAPLEEVNYSETGVKSVCQALDILVNAGEHLTYKDIVPTLPLTFDCAQHFQHVASSWLSRVSTSSEDDDTLRPSSLSTVYLEAILRPSLCRRFGTNDLMRLLIDIFADTKSWPNRLTRICLLGYSNWAEDQHVPITLLWKLMEIGIIDKLLQTATTSSPTAPYYMRFLWITSTQLLHNIKHGYPWEYDSSVSLLKMLHDHSTGVLHGEELPRNIGEMYFAEKWITELTNMCDNNIDAWNVLDSGILGAMIRFYQESGNEDTPSPTTELPNIFSQASTWLAILQELEADCGAAVERRIHQEGKGEVEGAEGERGAGPEGEGIGEPSSHNA